MAFTGITIGDLNYAARDLMMDPGLVQPDIKVVWPLLEALRGRLNTKKFDAAGSAQVLIETDRPITGTVHYENQDIPLPADVAYIAMSVPLREMIVNAGLTHDSLLRATGMPGSWVNAMVRSLELRSDDWNLLMDRTLMGVGKGRLARIVSASLSSTTLTVTCDNTYYDFGVENVAHIHKGDLVEVYATDLTTQRTDTATATSWEVTGVTFGDRANGASTTGTFTIETDSGHGFTDDDVVFIKGVNSGGTILGSLTNPLPMGLLGHVQDGGHYGSLATGSLLTTYQGLTRTSYDSLMSVVWDAVDFASGTGGTPDDWDLKVISDIFNACRRGSGKGMPNLLLCDSDLAMAITRRQRAEAGMTVNVSTGAASVQDSTKAVGALFAGNFTRPDGVNVPIAVVDTIPSNVLYGINTSDLVWHVFGGFTNWAPVLGLTAGPGDVWMKSPGDRKTNFEAPFGGKMQITGRRCDRHFVIMDMKDNI